MPIYFSRSFFTPAAIRILLPVRGVIRGSVGWSPAISAVRGRGRCPPCVRKYRSRAASSDSVARGVCVGEAGREEVSDVGRVEWDALVDGGHWGILGGSSRCPPRGWETLGWEGGEVGMEALSGKLRWVGGRRRRLGISSGPGGETTDESCVGIDGPSEVSGEGGGGNAALPGC